FFFSSRRRHTRFSRDWSSDVCSSDLKITANPRTGMDVNPGFRMRVFGQNTGNKRHSVHRQFVGKAIDTDGGKTRIRTDHLTEALRCRLALHTRPCVCQHDLVYRGQSDKTLVSYAHIVAVRTSLCLLQQLQQLVTRLVKRLTHLLRTVKVQ